MLRTKSADRGKKRDRRERQRGRAESAAKDCHVEIRKWHRRRQLGVSAGYVYVSLVFSVAYTQRALALALAPLFHPSSHA